MVAGGTGPYNGISLASVENINGNWLLVLSLEIPAGWGASSAELVTTSEASSWFGKARQLQFDLGYEYTTDSIGAEAGIYANASTGGLTILGITQSDATPLSGASPMTTYTIPWDGSSVFNLFPVIFTPETGSVSLKVMLDNVRVVPEPSTWVLAATALVGVPCFAARRRRR